MVPSDCFSSTVKKDRHVVSGIRPEETDLYSNTRKKKEISVCVYIYVGRRGLLKYEVKPKRQMNLFYSMEGSWSLFQSPIWISSWQIEYGSSLLRSRRNFQKRHNENAPQSPSTCLHWQHNGPSPQAQTELARITAIIPPEREGTTAAQCSVLAAVGAVCVWYRLILWDWFYPHSTDKTETWSS